MGGLPVQAITDHLVWASDGSVWACFEVSPFAYPHRSVRDATEIHTRTQAALLALPERSLILSVTHRLSPTEVTRRVAGVEPPPGWAAHATRTAVTVDAYERMWVLAVRLPHHNPATGLLGRVRAAGSQTAAAGFGRPHTPPTRRAITHALTKAMGIEERLAPHIAITRLSGGQVRWLYEHAVTRGLADLPLPRPTHRAPAVVVRRLDRDTVYVEGGRRTDPGRPRHWRYLTVEHPDLGVGFQSLLCLGELPAAWSFPFGSGEWLWHLDDQLTFPVDWAVTVDRVDNETARRRVMRARRNLTGQLEEPGSDPAGPSTTIASAADAVDDVRARLEANPQLPAFKATTVVAVADRDLAVVERRARMVESVFGQAEFNLYRPTGGQLGCFTAMLPGAPAVPVVAEYAQDLLPDGLASAMPFAGVGVGDPGGMLLGTCLDTPLPRPVFLDPSHGPRDLNRSGSLAAIGELGSGKSFFAKTLTWGTVAMGGQVVAVDRTERGEYAALVPTLPGTSQIVEITSTAQISLDPFQVFDTDELRLRYGVGFLTLLTGTPPGSPAGALCHRACHNALEAAAIAGRTPRLGDVAAHLTAAGDAGTELADQLTALAGVAEARLVLDHDNPAPPVDLTADYVCFHAPGLRLARRGTSRDELLPEELIGQAVLYLIAAISRRVLFRHPHRFAALLLDEAHAVTTNPQGRALITELIRDGRKHYAAVWAFSQLPGDLSADADDTAGLDTLLGYRAVFRQPRHTAAAALAFLGSDDREANIDTLCGLGTGECLLRDPTGRLGVVRITPPDDPTLLAAFTTTPTTTAAGTDGDGEWTLWQSLNNGHRTADQHTPRGAP